jgi:hypothetical protein
MLVIIFTLKSPKNHPKSNGDSPFSRTISILLLQRYNILGQNANGVSRAVFVIFQHFYISRKGCDPKTSEGIYVVIKLFN